MVVRWIKSQIILQILDQCTYRLGLNSAARRIYTEDGTMIMEIEDLIEWAVDNYKTLMAEYLQGKDTKGKNWTYHDNQIILISEQLKKHGQSFTSLKGIMNS